MLPFYLIIFLFGLLIGSFLDCLIYRLELREGVEEIEKGPNNPAKGGVLRGRSFCPQCKHTLSWKDLFPVFSFIFLKGKCRYCKKKISWQYPLVEILTAVVFLLIFRFSIPIVEITSFVRYGTSLSFILNLVYLLIISCFLLIIFVFDLKHYIIPDEVIYSAIVVSGIWYTVASIFLNFYTKYEILNNLYSALGAAGFFLAIVLVSKGKWMGVGDIKLAFLMGLVLGWPQILVALLLAFWGGAIVGIILIGFKKKGLKSEIPFGPFLITANFISLFYGEQIIKWYLNLIKIA